MSDGPIDYLELTRQGLRSVMSRALLHTAEHGLYGDQHFFLTFLTQHPSVVMPDWLIEENPEEITIVLQYEFEDLAVMSDRFSVGLSFGGRPATLVIPFAAVKTFADPSVNFRIDIPLAEPDRSEAGTIQGAMTTSHDAPGAGGVPATIATDGEDTDADSAGRSSEGTVVSLDAFRKK